MAPPANIKWTSQLSKASEAGLLGGRPALCELHGDIDNDLMLAAT